MVNNKTIVRIKAFSYAAGEFLDEELDHIEDIIGEDHPFFKNGEYRVNKDSTHPHEW